MTDVPRLEDLGDLDGKSVLVRADFNVPISDGEITDDLRIRAAIPTLRYLIEAGARTTFDLSGVNRSDSAGVALLLEWRRCAMERHAVLEFDGVPAQLRTIAATSNLEELFEPAATGQVEVSAAGSAA